MVVTHLAVKSCHGFLSSVNFLLEKCYCFWLLYFQTKINCLGPRSTVVELKIIHHFCHFRYSWVGRRLRSFELENRFEDLLSGSISSFAGSVPPPEEFFSKYYCYKHSLYKYYKKLQAIFTKKLTIYHCFWSLCLVSSVYLQPTHVMPSKKFAKWSIANEKDQFSLLIIMFYPN